MAATDPLVLALQAALPQALRSRDADAASAVRTALGAISNAEAVPVADGGPTRASSEHVAGAALGLGAAEAARRELSPAEVRTIVEGEVRERLDAAEEAERGGATAYAERLRREAAALRSVLEASAG